ncbi:hypothetical protein D3C81_2177620 [compost metagenome]
MVDRVGIGVVETFLRGLHQVRLGRQCPMRACVERLEAGVVQTLQVLLRQLHTARLRLL